jgi:hypothetical protein
MTFLFGGRSSPAPAPASSTTSGTQTTISREAPGVESRKLALYDEAIDLAKQPIEIPAYETAGLSPLQQQALQKAETTGVGAPTATAGIGSLLQAGQTADAPLNIDAFMNPYESYVIGEINRQADIAQNKLAAEAITSNAFGGGREGVQRAELERRRLGLIGEARAGGFDQALQAAAADKALQTEADLQVGGQLLTAGAQQQDMFRQDINQLGQAGQLQRGVAQEALAADRATQIERAYEPFQRMEFAKGIMTALPTTASQVTQAAAPRVNPFAQAIGTGVTAAKGFDLFGQKYMG